MKISEQRLVIDPKPMYYKEIAQGFQISRILFTSLELDIFSKIGNEGKNVHQLASEINVNENALGRLLNALVNLGFLDKKVDLYLNKVDTLLYLSNDSPNYLGNLMHIASLWDVWSDLTYSIREGKPRKYQNLWEKDEQWIESFILATYHDAKQYASQIVPSIPLKNCLKMLDLGAGSGIYSIEFAKIYPKLSVIAYDLPQVIPITQKFIDRSGYQDRITTYGGDFNKDEIGEGYDFIFIADVLSEYPYRTILDLLKKAYNALNFGGIITVFETMYNDERTGPKEAIMQSLNLLVNTIGGDVLNDTDIWFAMREAWFDDLYRINTDFGKSLVIGFK
ncbi:MAG TPA: methyltransferase [Bacteroidota bacterium]|nr:methyltransferase [Candidatus Kapabacteria bacterium]HRS02154.1 methyltransferase [Bacteroidota bacterium]